MRLKNTLLLLLLLLAVSLHCGAVEANNTARSISADEWRRLTTDKAYDYKNEVEKQMDPQNNEPNAFIKALQRFFAFMAMGVGRFLLWVFVFGLLAYVIYRLVTDSENYFWGRKRKEIKTTAPPVNYDDIASTNWQELMEKAIAAQDFRQAVRFGYMLLLQSLEQSQFIKYRQDKTNYEYSRELESTPFKKGFRSLSRQYEYIFYGNYTINETECNTYVSQIKTINQQLKP